MCYTTQLEVSSFIKEYTSSRVVVESTVRAVLNRALSYERTFKKPFYDFTKDEILKMFKESHTISITAVQTSCTVLRNAAKWIKFEKGNDMSNVYDNITKEDLKQCIDIEKKNSMLVTRRQLTEIQDELLNDTDRAMLELLFLGVGGRWCRELTYLDRDQVSFSEKRIYFKTGKIINIDSRCADILAKAFDEDELISYSGLMKVSKVNSFGIYKLRNNALSSNDNPNDEGDQERRFRFLQRRLLIISEYVDVQLKASMIQDSGLLHRLQIGITTSDIPFREFVHSEQCRILARQFDIYSEFTPSILISKFGQYFE